MVCKIIIHAIGCNQIKRGTGLQVEMVAITRRNRQPKANGRLRMAFIPKWLVNRIDAPNFSDHTWITKIHDILICYL